MSNGKRKMTFLFLFNNPNQVRDLCDRTTHRRRVRTFDDLVELRQPEAANYFLLLHRARDRTTVILNPDFGRLGGLASWVSGHIDTRNEKIPSRLKLFNLLAAPT